MDMYSRNQYLEVLREEYLKVLKKKKSQLLDEAQKRTNLSRKHLIVKLRATSNLKVNPVRDPDLVDEAFLKKTKRTEFIIPTLSGEAFSNGVKPRKKRKECYDGKVYDALVKVWEIFDYPCGQRLAPILKSEVKRLRDLKEIILSSEVEEKLKQISPATIDIKLRHQREVLHLRRNRHPKTQPLLYKKIPVKLIDEWDKEEIGNLQLDFVAHCGTSAFGDFINSLSATDISSSWWEAEGIMGRGKG